MNKLYKIILILTGVIFLFSGCSRDPIREVLKNVEGVPRKEKDRSINWYKMNPQISEKVKMLVIKILVNIFREKIV